MKRRTVSPTLAFIAPKRLPVIALNAPLKTTYVGLSRSRRSESNSRGPGVPGRLLRVGFVLAKMENSRSTWGRPRSGSADHAVHPSRDMDVHLSRHRTVIGEGARIHRLEGNGLALPGQNRQRVGARRPGRTPHGDRWNATVLL